MGVWQSLRQGDQGVYQGCVRKVCLGVKRHHGVVVLGFFGWVGLGVDKLCNFELVGLGGENIWSDDDVDFLYLDLVHCFQFADVSREV